MRLVDHPVELLAAGYTVTEELRRRELLVCACGLWGRDQVEEDMSRTYLEDPAIAAETDPVHGVVRVGDGKDLATGEGVDRGEDGGEHQTVGGHVHCVGEARGGEAPHLGGGNVMSRRVVDQGVTGRG